MTHDGPEFMARQRAAWSAPPVDDVGYIPSPQLLAKSDDDLRAIVEQMRATRYQGWRNHNGLWRDVMGIDEPGRDVLDFGCGTGVEALELALAGNRVQLADISVDNLHVAVRVLRLYADQLPHMGNLVIHHVHDEAPYINADPGSLDTFHASGVLHHIPWARQIMERAHELLRPGGTVRLMLYSDLGWQQATSTEPPDDAPSHPAYQQFVRHFDQVGEYADWYNHARLHQRFGDLFTIERVEYLTPNGQYLGAVLRKETSG